MTDIWKHVSPLYVSTFSVGLLLSVHHSHVNLREVTPEHRDHHSRDSRDTGCRHDIMERGRLWGEVHLRREGPTCGGSVWKQRQDTSREILTQKPGPETLPQLHRGMQQSRPSLFGALRSCYHPFFPIYLSGMSACTVVVYVLCSCRLFASLGHPSSYSSILRREVLDMLLSNFSLSSLLCMCWGKDGERRAPQHTAWGLYD